MTNNNKNTVQQVANKYCIYAYVFNYTTLLHQANCI